MYFLLKVIGKSRLFCCPYSIHMFSYIIFIVSLAESSKYIREGTIFVSRIHIMTVSMNYFISLFSQFSYFAKHDIV